MEVKTRIVSVDILRGVTIAAMILVNTPGTWGHIYAPLRHADWHGLTPTDLIFPFFLFIVGISIHYAYTNKETNRALYQKITIRSLKLIGLGLVLNLFTPYLPFFVDLDTVRIPGVLQRIGIVFFISAQLYIHTNWKSLLAIALLILLGYWLFIGFVSFPEGMQPTFDRAPNNWALYIDQKILGTHMWKPDYDPEGLVSTIPSIATCLIGVLIGRLLSSNFSKKLQALFASAMLMLILGYIWDYWFPMNKALWTSSYVLATAGWATFILTIVYYFSDIRAVKFGSIFKYVGMNAITIYFVSSLITKAFFIIKVSDNDNIHSWLYGQLSSTISFSPEFSSMLYALIVMLFYLLLGYWMYKKKLFIKV